MIIKMFLLALVGLAGFSGLQASEIERFRLDYAHDYVKSGNHRPAVLYLRQKFEAHYPDVELEDYNIVQVQVHGKGHPDNYVDKVQLRLGNFYSTKKGLKKYYCARQSECFPSADKRGFEVETFKNFSKTLGSPWQLLVHGRVMVRKVVLFLERKKDRPAYDSTDPVVLQARMNDVHIPNSEFTLTLKQKLQELYPDMIYQFYRLDKVLLNMKTRNGGGTARLRVGNYLSPKKLIRGNDRLFDTNPQQSTFDVVTIKNGKENFRADDDWNIELNGEFKIRNITAILRMRNGDYQTVGHLGAPPRLSQGGFHFYPRSSDTNRVTRVRLEGVQNKLYIIRGYIHYEDGTRKQFLQGSSNRIITKGKRETFRLPKPHKPIEKVIFEAAGPINRDTPDGYRSSARVRFYVRK